MRIKQVLSQSRNFSHFLQPECSLQYSQEPTIYPYPEPDQSIPWLPIPLAKTHFEEVGLGEWHGLDWSSSGQGLMVGWLFYGSHWIPSLRTTETWITNLKDPEFTNQCPEIENKKDYWLFLQHSVVMERKFNKEVNIRVKVILTFRRRIFFSNFSTPCI